MNDVELKIVEKKDVSILYELLKELAIDLGKSHEFKSSVQDIEKFGFSQPPSFEAIMAWHNDQPIGLILFFYEFSTWRGTPGLYVQDLFVSAQARTMGLGKKLISAAIARGQERGATYMRLALHEGNEAGLGFYKSIGFEAVSGETTLKLEFDQKIMNEDEK